MIGSIFERSEFLLQILACLTFHIFTTRLKINHIVTDAISAKIISWAATLKKLLQPQRWRKKRRDKKKQNYYHWLATSGVVWNLKAQIRNLKVYFWILSRKNRNVNWGVFSEYLVLRFAESAFEFQVKSLSFPVFGVFGLSGFQCKALSPRFFHILDFPARPL